MNNLQEQALVSGGEITLHSHPHTVTLDQLHRMQELEKVVFATGGYTVLKDDDIIFVSANGTITLPLASNGKHVIISATGAATSVTVQPQSGETVNGASSYTISTTYQPLRLKAIKGVGYLEI